MPHPQENPILDSAASANSPVPAKSSLEIIKAAQAASSARLVETRIDVEAGTVKAGEVGAVMVEAIEEISMADQIITLTTQNADLRAQNANIAVLQASGGTQAQVDRMKRLVTDSARVENLLNERSDIVDDTPTGIGLIDSVINGFRTIQVDAEITAAVAERIQTTGEIANISAATESVTKVNAVTKETLNSAVIEAGQKRIASIATVDAGRLELQNIHSDASSMATLAAADARFVDNLVSVYRLEGEEESRTIQTEQINFERERLEVRRTQLPIELAQAEVNLKRTTLALQNAQATNPSAVSATLAANEAAIQDRNLLLAERTAVVEQVQRGQALYGVPIQDEAAILFGLDQSGIIGESYAALFLSGTATTNPVIGSTPADASNNMLLVDPSGQATKTKATDIINTIRHQQATIYAASADGAPRDQATLDANFNLTAQEFITPYKGEIKLGDASNPFLAPPMATLATYASVRDSALYDKVLKPMSLQETDHTKIVQAAVDGFASGTLTSNEAATGLVTLFSAAAAHNSTFEGGLVRIGFDRQIAYPVTLPATLGLRGILGLVVSSAAFIAGPTIKRAESLDFVDFVDVDLMNITEVQSYLTARLSTAKDFTDTSAQENIESAAGVEGDQ